MLLSASARRCSASSVLWASCSWARAVASATSAPASAWASSRSRLGLGPGQVDRAGRGRALLRGPVRGVGEDLLALRLGSAHQQRRLLGGVRDGLLGLLGGGLELLAGELHDAGGLGTVRGRLVVQAGGLELRLAAQGGGLVGVLLGVRAQLVGDLLGAAQQVRGGTLGGDHLGAGHVFLRDVTHDAAAPVARSVRRRVDALPSHAYLEVLSCPERAGPRPGAAAETRADGRVGALQLDVPQKFTRRKRVTGR